MSYQDQRERQVWIQTNLNAGRELSYRNLMDRFEIVKSTAKTDFKYFTDLGLIRMNRSTKRFEIVDKLKPLPDLYISQREWMALLLAEQLLKDQAGTLSQQLRRLIDRYKKTMIPVAAASWVQAGISAYLTHVEAIDDGVFYHCLFALFEQQVMEFTYHKAYENSTGRRTASPQHLLVEDGKWLLVCWDHDRQALRNFMPSRMEAVRPRDVARFRHIDPPLLHEHLHSSYGIFKGRQIATAVLLFSAQLSPWAMRQHWHPRAHKVLRPDNRLELHLPIASQTGILQEVLKYGAEVEVLEPPSLKEKVRMELKKMQKMYEKN